MGMGEAVGLQRATYGKALCDYYVCIWNPFHWVHVSVKSVPLCCSHQENVPQ